MKLAKKFFSTFSIPIFFMIIITIFASTAFSTVSKYVDHIYNGSLQEIKNVDAIQLYTNSISEKTFQAIISDDEKEINEHINTIMEEIAVIESSVNSFKAENEVDVSDIENIETGINEIKNIINNEKSTILNGKTDECYNLELVLIDDLRANESEKYKSNSLQR